MADFYASHYAAVSSPTSPPPQVYPDPSVVSPSGVSSSHSIFNRARLDFSALKDLTDFNSNTILRCFTMKSGDRPLRLVLSKGGTWAATTLTLHIGLYAVNSTHTGEVLDINLFSSSRSFLSTTADQEVLINAGNVTVVDRGQPLWEMLAITDGDDTFDPMTQYDIAISASTVNTLTSVGIIYLECEYIPSGSS